MLGANTTNLIIQALTAVLQLICAILVYRLLPLTRWRAALVWTAIAMALYASYKVVDVILHVINPEMYQIRLSKEIFHLIASTILLVGLIKVRHILLFSQRADEISQLFVNRSNQGLVIYQDGKIVFVNPAFEYLTGYHADAMLSMQTKQIGHLFHPLDRENIVRFLSAGQLDSPSLRREMRIQNKRGITFWLETYFSQAIFGGKPAIQMTFVNITDRKRIESALHESEQRHRIISQLTSDYIYSAIVQPDNSVKTEWISGAFERITGYNPDEFLKQNLNWNALGHPDDRLNVVEAHTFALSNQLMVVEYRIFSKHGEVVWLRDYLQPIWDEAEQRVTRIIGAIQDITSRKIAEAALKESEARFRSLAENAPTVIVTVDSQHRVLWMNRPLTQPIGEAIGKDFHGLLPANARARFHRALKTVFSNGTPQRHEVDLTGPDSKIISYEVIIGPIRQDGLVSAAILVLTDITERKKVEDQLKYLSNHDILTGLYNRAFFETELNRMQNSRLYPVTVVMVDVNKLKETNDRYGHAAGDDLIRSIAQVMRESFRSEDIVSRIGGDEFAVLLPDTTEAAARAILDRLNERLIAKNSTQPEPLQLSLSIGAATGDEEANLVEIMKKADNLMYEDKARQKGTSPLKN